MSSKKIALIVGSLRKDSFNRKVANTLIKLAPASLNLEILEIGELSLYNEDLDKNPPAPWTNFRNKLKTFDGVIFLTPEYNRSYTALIKNALDVGSRPYGQSMWDGKPGAVISVSQGALGGFGANHHLRQTFVFLNIMIMQQPEAYIGNAGTLFDANGNLINDSTKNLLQKFLESYSQWVLKNSSK